MTISHGSLMNGSISKSYLTCEEYGLVMSHAGLAHVELFERQHAQVLSHMSRIQISYVSLVKDSMSAQDNMRAKDSMRASPVSHVMDMN